MEDQSSNNYSNIKIFSTNINNNKSFKIKLEISEQSNFIIYFMVYKYNHLRNDFSNEIMNQYTLYNSICYIYNIYNNNNSNINIPIDLSILFYYLFNKDNNNEINKYISDLNIIKKECEEIIRMYCKRIDTNSLRIIINKNIENEIIKNNKMEFSILMNGILIENIKKNKANIIVKKEYINIIINLMNKDKNEESIYNIFLNSVLLLNESDKDVMLIIWEMINNINNNEIIINNNNQSLLLEIFYNFIISTPLQLLFPVVASTNENILNKKLLGIKQPDKPAIYHPKSKLLIKQQKHLKTVYINDVYEYMKNKGKEMCSSYLLEKYNEIFKSYGLDEVRIFSNIKNGRKIDNLKFNEIKC